MNNQNFNNPYTIKNQENESKEWYESLWGLVALTVGLNLLSNWIYDRSREKVRRRDEARERRRNRRHLRDYHNKTREQAVYAEEISNKQSYNENE